ncbi:hypothetical protein D9619_011427 [Psilocybe cf. subviscida]|uniref:Amidase domain-containing protein n=1 Tax=Psilocybe cf. subviscida TaxID=2480587 RepID=A0A8H5BJ67_9AGAR|nr:hypothetical protein D9619_011427 [Psilocybe cf. subviscida]
MFGGRSSTRRDGVGVGTLSDPWKAGWLWMLPSSLWLTRQHSGGGAMVAGGGFVVDIITDAAGSVRIPAWLSAIFRMFACNRAHTSVPGTEDMPIVVGPMTRRMEDLCEFMRRILKIMRGDSNYISVYPSPGEISGLGLREGERKLQEVLFGMMLLLPQAQRSAVRWCLLVRLSRKSVMRW